MKNNKVGIAKLIFYVTIISIIFFNGPIAAQQSTSGPKRPTGVSTGIVKDVQKEAQGALAGLKMINGVPSYLWYRGCGPTALGMVIGYYDLNGYPDLINGEASTQTVDVGNAIATSGHYNDYSLPIDYSPNLLRDKSQDGGAHTSNCIADFMNTSWSSRSNYWGWSWNSDIEPAFINYVSFKNSSYKTYSTYVYYATEGCWGLYKTEIDNNRPVVLLVDSDGDGYTDHFVTGIGYDQNNSQYAIYDTWDNQVHWFQWQGIANGNDWGIFGFNTLRIEAPPIVKDSLALVALYNATDGANWTNNTNWLTTEPVSSWFGVIVENNRITQINLVNNNLAGLIPAELGQLTNLRCLELYLNQITGSIPAELGQLTNLQRLYLSWNQLTGIVPSELVQLTNLQNLDLSVNQLTGSIPANLQQLTYLTLLDLHGNLLTGSIPAELGQLTNLEYLVLNQNQLTGSIPAELGQLTNLRCLELYSNQLTGSIPAELGQLTNLQRLYLSWNQLTGDVPSELEQLTNLQNLDLSVNQLTGSISANLQQLTYLKLLDLHGNQLTGSIPVELGQLTNLEYLALNQNQLTGSIPVEISQMANLEFMDVQSNQLDRIPDLTAPANLTDLIISNNKFSFEDLEYNMDLIPSVNFDYSPQDSIGVNIEFTKNVGENFSYTLLTGGENNNYQWYRDGEILVSQTSAILEINILDLGDAGKYYCEVANSQVPGLILTSRIITLLVEANAIETQNLALNTGWNIMSLKVMPENENLKDILQPLIDSGQLKKVMDESGKVIEDWGYFGGWQNTIGDLQNTEGYKINVTSPTTIEVTGTPSQFPFDIALNSGWNIISWPSPNEQNGMDVFQTLKVAGKLKKVMDESGKVIEDWGYFGGWQNNIGNFKPGEGYKVNVTSACTLTINESGIKSEVIIPELIASTHFIPAYKGNGADHMNINLVNLAESGILEGDEIGIFDGNICVGSAKINIQHSTFNIQPSSVSIPVSSIDGINAKNGYTEGNSIILKLYRNGSEYPLGLQPLNPDKAVFEKGSSLFVQVDMVTGIDGNPSSKIPEIKVYPNPFSEEVTIEINLAADAQVLMEVLNQLGQQVKIITTKKLLPGGLHKLTWNGRNASNQQVSPGVYHLKIEIDDTIFHRKVVVSK